MADVITRFKLETSQYDSKLRDASQGLAKMSQQLQMAGKDFDRFASNNVEAAKALGQIESGANNLKDKLKDLVGAYNNVAKAYNNLTNEQKQTDFGKAMAASLDQLKGRITQTKDELYNAGGALSGLKDKLTLNIDAFKLFNAGITAAKGALSVAKDAFFASEQNLDDWQRTVYASKSVYETFLTSLNTGDVSGFLNNINTIVSAATDAYNAIDRLQTMQNIQSPKLQAKQAEVQRMETMLRTGRYIAPVDGRKAAMAEGTVLTDAQKKTIAKQLESAMREIAGLIKNQVGAANDAIDALYREQATRLGMSLEQFRKGTSSMSTFEENLRKAQAYRQYEEEHTARVQMNTSAGVVTKNVRDTTRNPYEAYKGWAVFKDDGELYQRILSTIGSRTGMEQQYYNQIGRAYRGINRVEGGGAGGSGGAGGAGTVGQTTAKELNPLQEVQKEIASLTEEALTADANRLEVIKEEIAALRQIEMEYKNIQDYANGKRMDISVGVTPDEIAKNESSFETARKAMLDKMNAQLAEVDTTIFDRMLQTSVQHGIDSLNPDLATIQEKIAKGFDIPEEEWQALQDKINEHLQSLGIEPINIDFNTGDIKTLKKEGASIEQAWSGVAKSLESAGGALSAFEDPALNVAGTIAKSLANVAFAFAQSLKGTATPWDFIAGVAGGVAAMAAAVAAIKSIGKDTGNYADGGIIPGNSYSGDNMIAHVNSGELILNRAAQSSLASQLQGGGGNVGKSEAIVTSDTIKLVLRNGAQKRGKTISNYLEL